MFINICFSSPAHAHSNELFFSQPERFRFDDVAAELYIQFYFYDKLPLAVRIALLHAQQLCGQRDCGRFRLYACGNLHRQVSVFPLRQFPLLFYFQNLVLTIMQGWPYTVVVSNDYAVVTANDVS